MADFAGRVVILTGATGGFGKVAARYFADAGASLVLNDLHVEPLEALAAELSGNVRTIAGDISDPELSERLVEVALTEFGRLDVAVKQCRHRP